MYRPVECRITGLVVFAKCRTIETNVVSLFNPLKTYYFLKKFNLYNGIESEYMNNEIIFQLTVLSIILFHFWNK